MLKRVSACLFGLVLVDSASAFANSSAITYSSYIDINQTLAVAPADNSQLSSFSGAVNFNSLITDVSFTSGQYIPAYSSLALPDVKIIIK